MNAPLCLQDAIKQAVLEALRNGAGLDEIDTEIESAWHEFRDAKPYIKADRDKGMGP